MSIESIRHFLLPDDCRELIRLTNECPSGTLVEHTPRYTLQCKFLDPEFMHPIRDRLAKFLRVKYGRDLFPDLTITMRMGQDDAHGLHADAVTLDGEPNHTPYRVCVGMVYLNRQGVDYHGGKLRFPKLGIVISPEPGLLVAFPSDLEHQHEVDPVDGGERYSLSMWMTRDEMRRERWT